MSDSSNSSRRVRRAAAVAIVAIVVVGGGVAFAVSQANAEHGSSANPSDASVTRAPTAGAPTAPPTRPATIAPSPDPSDLVAPAPGATESVEQPPAAAPVPWSQPVTAGDKVTVAVEDVTAVTAGQDMPGEVRGPAVRVAVTVTNGGSEPVDVAGASTTLTYGGDQEIPAIGVADPGAVLWPTSLGAGEKATSVSYFSVPLDADGDVRVIVDLLASEPHIVFAGKRPE